MRGSRPPVVAFDVIETLFSLQPVADAVAPLEISLDAFFTRTLRDGFALAAAGDYRPFHAVARSALESVAPDVTEAQVDGVMDAFASLPAHADAEPALALLAEAGITVVTLTNGGLESTATLLESSGLARFVDEVFTVEGPRRWKPAAEPYQHAAARVGRLPEEVALVAVHAWDIHGARRAGLVTGWCSRLEGRYPSVFDPPDVTGPDLVAVARAMLAR